MVSWTKNGEPLDKKRVNIRSTDRDSILFIRSAEREDSGTYEMCVKVEDFEDKSVLILQIVGEQIIETVSKTALLQPSNKILQWNCVNGQSSTEAVLKGHNPARVSVLLGRQHFHHGKWDPI